MGISINSRNPIIKGMLKTSPAVDSRLIQREKPDSLLSGDRVLMSFFLLRSHSGKGSGGTPPPSSDAV
jgi:hypothetical protein